MIIYPFLLKAEQTLLSQIPVSCGPATNHHGYSPLDSVYFVNILIVLGSPALDAVTHLSHKCKAEGYDHFPQPADYVLTNAAHFIIMPSARY